MSAQDETIGRAELLLQAVISRAHPASSLAMAFYRFDAHRMADLEGPESVAKEAKLAAAALAEWAATATAERRRILAGWRPADRYPTAAQLKRKQQSCDSADTVGRYMHLTCGERGDVTASPEFDFVQVLHPVQVDIREGTSKADAIRALLSAIAMLESDWEKVIDLRDREIASAAGSWPQQPADREVLGKVPAASVNVGIELAVA